MKEEIERTKREKLSKDIDFNNLYDDHEKLKQELTETKINNLQLKNDLSEYKEKDEFNTADNNPINIEQNICEELKLKKVNFSEESKDRALERIKKMKEQKKKEKEKNKVRKSIKISNIVKSLEESRKIQRDEDNGNKNE